MRMRSITSETALRGLEPIVPLTPQAAQLAEVYWMALTRDVPFSKYGEDDATVAAAGISHVFAHPSCGISPDAISLHLAYRSMYIEGRLT